MKKPENLPKEQKELLIKIGKKLLRLRNDQKKGYETVAKEIGIPRNTYYQVESGNLNFQFSTILQIIKHYKMSVAEFFKDL